MNVVAGQDEVFKPTSPDVKFLWEDRPQHLLVTAPGVALVGQGSCCHDRGHAHFL